MKITKNMINIFRSVCAEHGNEEAIRRMNKILHLNLPDKLDVSLIFMPDFIVICEDNPLTITFKDDHYIAKRSFPTYDVFVYYNQNGYEFKRATSFKTQDGKRLVVDRLDAEQLQNTRIIKTTEDDTDFVNGYYEKEIMSINGIPIDESSSYIEYTNDDTEESRVLNVGDNMYYHHIYSISDTNLFLEASACIDTPLLLISGRTRDPRDLLYYSERTKHPNIFIRGNTVNEYKSVTSYYDLSIYKLPREGIINVKLDMVNQLDGSGTKKSYILSNVTKGPISKRDVLVIMKFIAMLNYPFTPQVIEELERFNEKLSIHKQEKLRDLDAIDLEIAMHPEYSDLAFHVYENLDKIDTLIEEQTRRGYQEEHKKTLG